MLEGLMSKELEFYFDDLLTSGLNLEYRILRSELLYSSDESPEVAALDYLKSLSSVFDGFMYLVVASHTSEQQTLLRRKKGIFWNFKPLKKLNNITSEVFYESDKSRLVGIVDLSGFNYDSCEQALLNWTSSFIILSNKKIIDMTKYIDTFISEDQESFIPFNFKSIANAINKLGETSVVRYFPADNGRHEVLALAETKDFDSNLLKNFNEIINKKGG